MTCTIHATTQPVVGPFFMNFDMSVSATNVGNALRRLDSTVAMTGAGAYTINSAAMNNDASASVAFSSSFPAGGGLLVFLLGGVACPVGLACYDFTIDIPIALFADHPLVDKDNASNGWFVRNRWHELSYYALAPGVAPSQAAPRSCTPPNCLTVNYVSASANYTPATPFAADQVRSVVVLGGRRLEIVPQTRPSATPGNYFEDVNTTSATNYAARAPTLVFNRTFNDRVVVIDHN